MDLSHIFLLAWTALIFWALGQIWFAQIVVYPLFARVGDAEYTTYHHTYSRRIPLPVILPGFAAFLAPVPLAFLGPQVPIWLNATNVAGGVVGLLVTVLLEIPRHARLERHGKDPDVIAELVRFNWPRTFSITLQGVVTLFMLRHVLVA